MHSANHVWPTLLREVVWVIVMTLVMGWLAKSRLKPRAASESRRLVHPRSTLVIGVAAFAFFAGLAIGTNVFPDTTASWKTTAVFAGFSVVSLLVVAEFILARHDVDEAGLSYGRLTGTRGYMLWSDLRSVRYAAGMKWFRLETHGGHVARVSAMLLGLPEFARVVLARAPREAIDTPTQAVLQATADGHPPSVWT